MRRMDGETLQDVDRIVQVCLDNGWLVSREEAYEMWRRRSEAWDAHWLSLPESDKEIFEDIESQLKEPL